MKVWYTVAMLAALGGSYGWAQGPALAQGLSLESAIQQALAGNPELGVARAQTDIARGQVKQAGLRPNPRVTVQTEDIRPATNQAPFSFANNTEDYLLVGQTIETGGKRGRRVDVANGNAGSAELQAQLTARQIALRVSAAYWNAALMQRLTELSEQTLRTYDQDVNYIRARVKEGVAAEADAVRIEVERDRLRLVAMQTRRDREQSMVNLVRAIGKADFSGARLSTPLDRREVPPMPALEQVLAQRPEIAIARQATATADSNLRLQRALGKPDPEVILGYKRNSGFDTAYAAVQVDLPVSNRNQGNVGSAMAQLRREQANLQLATVSVRAEYEGAQRFYQAEREMTEQLPGLVAQAQDSERRARAAYREGGLDLLRLLDAERSRIQVETDYARTLAELQQAIANLRAAAGGAMTEGAGK